MAVNDVSAGWIRNAHQGSIWPLGVGPKTGEFRLVASSGDPRNPGLALWDVKSGAMKWRNAGAGGDGAFQIVVVSTRRDFDVAVATERGIAVLSGATGEPVFGRRLGEETTWGVAAGFLSDGSSFIVGALAGGSVCRWSAETGGIIGSPMLGHDASVKAIDVLSCAGESAVILSGDEMGVVRKWNADTGEFVDSLRSGDGVELLTVGIGARSSPLFACADFESNVRVWDVRNGRQVGRTISIGAYPTGLALFDSGGSPHIAAASDDAVVGCWEIETGERFGEFPSGFSLAAGSNGAGRTVLVVGTIDGSICSIPV